MNTQDPKYISAKIKIYILTRAELLFTLCYEIPAQQRPCQDFNSKNKTNLKILTFPIEGCSAVAVGVAVDVVVAVAVAVAVAVVDVAAADGLK